MRASEERLGEYMTAFEYQEFMVIVGVLLVIGLPAAIGCALPIRPWGDYRRLLAQVCVALVLEASSCAIQRTVSGINIAAGLWTFGLALAGIFAAVLACAAGIRQAAHFRSWGAVIWLVVAGALPVIVVVAAYNYVVVLVFLIPSQSPQGWAQVDWLGQLSFVLAWLAPLGTVAYVLWGTLIARRHRSTGAAAA